MTYTPTDVAVQALDAIGSETTIGDLEEGSREARVLVRAYRLCLRQLLRSAHWDWARKMQPMTMLADATGSTQGIGTNVQRPWLYCYAYPTDCAKARFVPYSGVNPNTLAGNWAQPSIWGNGLVEVPPGAWGAGGNSNLAPVPAGPPGNRALRPAPFIISSDPNYPPQPGQELWAIPGVGNQGRTVILTNIYQAQLVYTEIVLEPQRWDDLFRAAFVAYLASEVALPLSKDKKFGLSLRAQQIQIVKQKLDVARVQNGNEAWTQTDINVDWMDVRRGENWRDGWTGPHGNWMGSYNGWDSIGFSTGDVY